MPINQKGEFYKDPNYEGIVNSTNTQPNTEIPYVSPKPSPIPSVAGLSIYDPSVLTKTEGEGKAQSLTEELQALNESLVGESAYRTSQETGQDIAGLTKTKTDLANQLKILQNEALAIPQQIQQEAQGRGMTAGGLGSLQTAALRNNAIKALSISALSEAANGNLATANDLVDRAVKAKYDPIREEINAKLANLNLILQSPDYTREEKNRATQMQQQLDIQKLQIDDNEENNKEIWTIAIQSSSNIQNFIPTQQYITASLALQAIQNAKTKGEALAIATETGLTGTPKEENFVYKELPDGRAVMLDTRGNIVKTIYTPPTTPTTEGQPIITLNGKPLTDAQNTSLGYAQRMNDANSIITELGNKMTGWFSAISGNKYFPNIFKSDDRQKYEQAQRNFVNAVLRKESGAAISPSEFDSASKQYFPQPGDSQAVIEQKSENRMRVISNLSQSANVSLESVIGSKNVSSMGTYEDYLKAIGQ